MSELTPHSEEVIPLAPVMYLPKSRRQTPERHRDADVTFIQISEKVAESETNESATNTTHGTEAHGFNREETDILSGVLDELQRDEVHIGVASFLWRRAQNLHTNGKDFETIHRTGCALRTLAQ